MCQTKFIPLDPFLLHHVVRRLPIHARMYSPYPFCGEVSLREVSWFKRDIGGAKDILSKIIKTMQDVVLTLLSYAIPSVFYNSSDRP